MRLFFNLLLLLSLLSGCTIAPLVSHRDHDLCVEKSWPHELSSTFNPDPAVQYGRLENGFRYAVMENTFPENRVFMSLRIGAGSLQENDQQKGAAHFLEHMMFNGTKHFPSGELVKQLQKIGMEFGRDVNAHTSYDETVFFINLPSGSKQQVELGLQILADYAFGALLEESDFEQERGVILAEKRSRDSVGQRLYKKGSEFTFQGTRLPKRWVIGDEQSLKTMTVDDLRNYYTAWYRPDNMVLSVVGDVQSDDIIGKIRRQFSSFAASSSEPECISMGNLERAETYPEILYYAEQESESVSLSLETIRKNIPESDNANQRQKALYYHLINKMMNARLQKIVEGEKTTLSSVNYHSFNAYNRYRLNMLVTRVTPQDWQGSFDELLTILLTVRQYGFSEQELQAAKKSVQAELNSMLQKQDSRKSRDLAESLLEHVAENKVFLSPGQQLEIYSPIVKGASIDELNKIFQTEWTLNRLKIKIMGKLVPEDRKAVDEIFFNGVHRKIERPVFHENGGFPYLPAPENQDLSYTSRVYKEIGVERIQLSNGLPVYLKKTDFQQAEVKVSVLFGNGKIMTVKPGLSMLAESTVNNSGTGKLSLSVLDEQLAGYKISSRFAVDEQNSVLTGASTPDDLEHLFELLYAQVADPGVREKVFDNQKKRLLQMAENMEKSPEGIFYVDGQRFLASGDKRFGKADVKEMLDISYDEVKEWYSKEVSQGLMQISVVGDFDRNHVIELVQKYFSSVVVDNGPIHEMGNVIFPSGKSFERSLESDVEKALVVMAWPVTSNWQIETARHLNVVASLFEEKVRSVLREKIGAVYSPSVYMFYPRYIQHYGYIALYMVIDAKRLQETVSSVGEIVRELSEKKIDPELSERVLRPIIRNIEERIKTNDYWLNTVLAAASRYPDQFSFASSLKNAYSNIEIKDIQDLTSKVFHNKRAQITIVAGKK